MVEDATCDETYCMYNLVVLIVIFTLVSCFWLSARVAFHSACSVKEMAKASWRSQASKLVVTTPNGVPTNSRDWRVMPGRFAGFHG